MNFDTSTLTSPPFLIGAAVVLLIIVIAAIFAAQLHKNKTAELRARFGPEYDLVLAEDRSARKAEARLLAREKRVQGLRIRELTEPERAHYLAEWATIQSRFVDHPRGSVTDADELIGTVLQTRGYPGGGFEQRAEDMSVNHCHLVGPYRSAYAITSRAGRNESTTEELRNAMIHYRTILEELLHTTAPREQRMVA
jgi:hypothetical protein